MLGPRLHPLSNEDGPASLPGPDEARNMRLMALQMEALGTPRRDYISTTDFPENLQVPDLEVLEQTRLSNIPGTSEHRQLEQHREQISAWNTIYQEIENDGTVDEGLVDSNRGQVHRAKLVQEASGRDSQHSPESKRGNRSRRGGRAGGGTRGGASLGNRGQSSRSRNTSAGYSESPSGATRGPIGYNPQRRNDPFVGGSSLSTERRTPSTPLGAVPTPVARLHPTPSRAIPPPTTSKHSTPVRASQTPAARTHSIPVRAVPAPALSQPVSQPASQPASRQNIAAGSQSSPSAVKRPSMSSWSSKLASPEDFMAAVTGLAKSTQTEQRVDASKGEATNITKHTEAIVNPKTSMASGNLEHGIKLTVDQAATNDVTETTPAPVTIVDKEDIMTEKESSQTSVIFQDDNQFVTETVPAPVTIVIPEGSGQKSLPRPFLEVIDEVSDVLVSTDTGSSHERSRSMLPSPLEERRSSFYNDLIGLEMESGLSSSLAVETDSKSMAAVSSALENDSKEIPEDPGAQDSKELAEEPVQKAIGLLNDIEELIDVLVRATNKTAIKQLIIGYIAQLKEHFALQAHPKTKFKKPIAAAEVPEKARVLEQVQKVQIQPSRKGKERISDDAEEPREATLIKQSIEKDLHKGPAANRDETTITDTAHTMLGPLSQSSNSRTEAFSSSSESTPKASLANPALETSLESDVVPLAAGFARLSLKNPSQTEAALRVAKASPFNSATSNPSAPLFSTTNLPSSEPVLLASRTDLPNVAVSNTPRSVRSGSSGSVFTSQVVPALAPQSTDSTDPVADESAESLLARSPFFVAQAPRPGGSMLNKVGYFRGENQPPGLTGRLTPTTRFQPNVRAPPFQPGVAAAPLTAPDRPTMPVTPTQSNLSADTLRGTGDVVDRK